MLTYKEWNKLSDNKKWETYYMSNLSLSDIFRSMSEFPIEDDSTVLTYYNTVITPTLRGLTPDKAAKALKKINKIMKRYDRDNDPEPTIEQTIGALRAVISKYKK